VSNMNESCTLIMKSYGNRSSLRISLGDNSDLENSKMLLGISKDIVFDEENILKLVYLFGFIKAVLKDTLNMFLFDIAPVFSKNDSLFY